MNTQIKNLKQEILMANGFEKADFVFKNANIINLFTEEIIVMIMICCLQ